MKKSLSLLFLILLVFASAAPAAAQIDQVETIEISQVDDSNFPEMTVYVRILDASGQSVPNLVQQNFEITEDGKLVDITGFQSSNAEPVSTLMLMDISGSMNESGKIEAAREAATEFVDLMRPGDQLSLWFFNAMVLKASDFTPDTALLKAELSRVFAVGGTGWYDAVVEASSALAQRSGRRSLLLLSDGQDTGSQNSFQAALRAAIDSKSPVYTIGLGQGRQIAAGELSRLATETGGTFYQTPSGEQLKELYQKINQSTKDEYVFTYTSPRAVPDGTRRDIEIKIGGASNSTTYSEEHLLNIQSDPLVALLAAIPLLALLFGPWLARSLAARWKRRAPKLVSPAAQSPVATPGHLFCNACGRPVKPGVRFCSACGAPTAPPAVQTPAYQPPAQPPPAAPAPKFCKACGHPIRPGVRFCSKCGQQF